MSMAAAQAILAPVTLLDLAQVVAVQLAVVADTVQ